MRLSHLLPADERLPPEASPAPSGGAEVVRRSVGAEGSRISYLAAEPAGAGSPHTLLLIHGAGVSARSWTCQLRGLGRSLRVLAIDLPGHGESDPIAEATVERYADAARALLDVLGTGPVFVAGHSLGGAVAQALAGCAPDAVRGLILVATCARLPERADWLPRLLWWLPPLVRKAVFFSLAKKLVFAARAPQEAVLLGLEEIRTCRPETILKDVAAARAMNLEAVAQGLRAPTLILCGREDRLTPLLLSQRLNELIPGSRLVLVDGAAHMLPLEAPEQVNRAVLAFVESVAAGTLVRDAAAGAAEDDPSPAASRMVDVALPPSPPLTWFPDEARPVTCQSFMDRRSRALNDCGD